MDMGSRGKKKQSAGADIRIRKSSHMLKRIHYQGDKANKSALGSISPPKEQMNGTLDTKESTNYHASNPKLSGGGQTTISKPDLSFYRNPLDVLQPNDVLFSPSNIAKNNDKYFGNPNATYGLMSHRVIEPPELI